jgi:hypothetical protein
MAEVSKTAKASMVTQKVEKVDSFDTPEKKIAELRKQRDAKLAVVRYDFIDALLAEYDAQVARRREVERRNEELTKGLLDRDARIHELEHPAPPATVEQ